MKRTIEAPRTGKRPGFKLASACLPIFMGCFCILYAAAVALDLTLKANALAF